MKHRKLMIISAIALLSVLAVTATAFAANADQEAVPADAAEIAAEEIRADDGTVSECCYEVDLETGEISCDGKVIDTIKSFDADGEIVSITTTASGDDLGDVSFSFSDEAGEDVRYFWIEDGNNGEDISVTAVGSADDTASAVSSAE